MTSNPIQDMSVNSWKKMPKQERTKMILQLQEGNNKLMLEIDENQKKLVDLRCEVPEECRKMFEEEKSTLLKHYTTANLFPEVPKSGFGAEEKDRMINNIKERVEEKVADCKETKSIVAATEQINHKNELLRTEIFTLAEKLLENLKN